MLQKKGFPLQNNKEFKEFVWNKKKFSFIITLLEVKKINKKNLLFYTKLLFTRSAQSSKVLNLKKFSSSNS